MNTNFPNGTSDIIAVLLEFLIPILSGGITFRYDIIKSHW